MSNSDLSFSAASLSVSFSCPILFIFSACSELPSLEVSFSNSCSCFSRVFTFSCCKTYLRFFSSTSFLAFETDSFAFSTFFFNSAILLEFVSLLFLASFNSSVNFSRFELILLRLVSASLPLAAVFSACSASDFACSTFFLSSASSASSVDLAFSSFAKSSAVSSWSSFASLASSSFAAFSSDLILFTCSAFCLASSATFLAFSASSTALFFSSMRCLAFAIF